MELRFTKAREVYNRSGLGEKHDQKGSAKSGAQAMTVETGFSRFLERKEAVVLTKANKHQPGERLMRKKGMSAERSFPSSKTKARLEIQSRAP